MTALSQRQTQAATQLVNNALTNMRTALTHIEHELAYTSHNVYPSTTIGDGGSRSAGTRSPVERLVIDSRQRLRDNEAQMWDDYNALVSIAHHLSNVARKSSGQRVPHPQAERCNHGRGKGLEGFTLWQDEQCERFPGDNPVIEGLCDQCLDRMNQWRLDNGYERIVRDADSVNYRHTNRGESGRFTAA